MLITVSIATGCQQKPAPAAASAAPASPTGDAKASTLEADVAHLKDITPSQSHTMIDVGYHMSNLWFAAQHKNWDLAAFEVDDCDKFVTVSAEAALRKLAMSYPYDSHDEAGQLSLRSNPHEIAEHLKHEMQERLELAGVQVIEARISNLAYAPEIAQAMLRRQQASAVIAARQRIVDGSVGMVEMALERLSQKNIVHLDEERKAAMVSNLLVVLCSEAPAQPIVNTGTLYQ